MTSQSGRAQEVGLAEDQFTGGGVRLRLESSAGSRPRLALGQPRWEPQCPGGRGPHLGRGSWWRGVGPHLRGEF